MKITNNSVFTDQEIVYYSRKATILQSVKTNIFSALIFCVGLIVFFLDMYILKNNFAKTFSIVLMAQAALLIISRI
ncbi:MAG: hypothetical protein ACRC5M_00160, partial [Anaeroplasmataceae bacterium]